MEQQGPAIFLGLMAFLQFVATATAAFAAVRSADAAGRSAKATQQAVEATQRSAAEAERATALAAEQRRLTVFPQRYEIFDAVRRFYGKVGETGGMIESSDVLAYHVGTREKDFFFLPDLVDRLSHLGHEAGRLRITAGVLDDLDERRIGQSEQRSKAVEEHTKVLAWIQDERASLWEHFKNYLAFREP